MAVPLVWLKRMSLCACTYYFFLGLPIFFLGCDIKVGGSETAHLGRHQYHQHASTMTTIRFLLTAMVRARLFLVQICYTVASPTKYASLSPLTNNSDLALLDHAEALWLVFFDFKEIGQERGYGVFMGTRILSERSSKFWERHGIRLRFLYIEDEMCTPSAKYIFCCNEYNKKPFARMFSESIWERMGPRSLRLIYESRYIVHMLRHHQRPTATIQIRLFLRFDFRFDKNLLHPDRDLH